MTTFQKLPAQVHLPTVEEGIIRLWERLDAFRESDRRRQAQGGPAFVFYDGPPFATGTPHYGHLLAGTIKDIVPRFWSMRGCTVDRRFGWDCHGLPIENLGQKALGLNGTPEIRAHGVDRFNEQCRSMVQTYVAEWRRTVTRMGRWVDFDRDYKTMDKDFMESVWWVFKRLWDQGRVYKAHRIMPYSPKLTTPLSNFEAGNNYQDVQDPAVTVRFRVTPGAGVPDRASILAWTTTPWTLPENLALCAGPDITYCWVEDAGSGEVYLLAKDRIGAYYKKPEQYRVLREVLGKDLAGLTYEPLFPYFAAQPNAFRLLTDGFVTTGDGTGIVHIAPAYGEDDYRVARAAGIDLVDPLDEQCCFTAQVPEYAGQFCKDADKAIIKRLKDEGKLVHQSTIVHSYPFCERSGAPLIYRAMEAWYVRVSDLRPRMVELNKTIRWVPEGVGSNRFGNFISDGPDWNISRNRFWGSCLPVWVNEQDPDDRICVGSVTELEQLAGLAAGTITDLHKHHLDGVVIRRDGKTYRRTPEVLDCWFESGAMPYAQVHWMGGADGTQAPPVFPAQFIAEGLDQTRGWFYSLLVLSTALFDKPAFRNVVVNGLVLAEDGQKMSKSKQNYPDPHKVLDAYGADALRAYLIDSPVVRAEPLRFSEAGLKEIVRTVVLPYWNALGFFTTYASVDGFSPADTAWTARPIGERHALDRWLVRSLESLVRDVNTEMEAYRLYTVVPRLVQFIDDLTNWYIRCSRRRFWRSEDRQAQADAYHTLYGVLVEFAKVLAPFMPFLTEEVYQRLVVAVDKDAPKSIHWCDYPQAAAGSVDPIVADMAWVQRAVALGRKLREDQKLKIRQPLASFTVVHRDPAIRAAIDRYAAIIADELNVKQVLTDADESRFASVSVKPNFAELRKRCGPKLKEIGAALAAWTAAEIAAVEAGGTVACCGEQLGAADVLLQRSAKPGLAVSTDGTLTVSMDTVVTDALKAEGHAREAISLLQQARKDAGLEVSDRIRVTWSTDAADLAAALRHHTATIADEVLAVAVAEGAIDAAPVDCNGMALRLAVAKA